MKAVAVQTAAYLPQPIRRGRTCGVERLDIGRVGHVGPATEVNEIAAAVNRRTPPVRDLRQDKLPDTRVSTRQ